jgi:hypothetical protein
MWNKRLERHAASMRRRFAREAEKEAARLLKQQKKEEKANRRLALEIERTKNSRTAFLFATFCASRKLFLSWMEFFVRCPWLVPVLLTFRPESTKTEPPKYDRFRRPEKLKCTEEEIAILHKHGLHTSRAAKELDWSAERVMRYGLSLGVFTEEDLIARIGRKGRPKNPPKPPQAKQERQRKYVSTPEIDALIISETPTKDIAQQIGWPRQAIWKRRKEIGHGRPVGSPKYHATPEIDKVMRTYPGEFTKVGSIIDWPVWAVERRMKELNVGNGTNYRFRDDEAEIVQLLKDNQGCIADVRRILKAKGQSRTEKFVKTIRDKHGIVFTKKIVIPSTKGQTKALDGFVQSLLELSTRKRKEYFQTMHRALPEVLSRSVISNLIHVSRKTIDSYVKQGWLPIEKNEFVQFLIDQCDYMSAMQGNEHQETATANG